VDKSLSIFSFSRFRRVPAAALLAAVLFVVAESAVVLLWRPEVVGERLYGRFSPSYDYGYASDVPRLFRDGADWRFYPTEYVNIRPFSIRRAKPEDEIRIFVLGGSVSRGSGVPRGTDYASRLEHALDEQLPQYDWNVVNLSADGFGTTRMVRILTHMARYRPDALIVQPHGTNEYEDERDAHYREELRAGINGLVLRSHLLVLLKKAELFVLRTDNRLLAEVEDEQSASLDPENTRRWEVVFATNIERTDCVIHELGIPAIYVGRAERDAPAFRNGRVERLDAPIRDEPVFVDVAAVLAKAAAERPGVTLWYNNTHYSEAGHAVVARALLEQFLPDGPILDRIVSRRALATPRPEEIAAHCGTLRPIEVGRGGGGKP
jgi:hypothetical protein